MQQSPVRKAWALRTAISRALGTSRIARAGVHDNPNDDPYRVNKHREEVITGLKLRTDKSMRWPVFWLGVLVYMSIPAEAKYCGFEVIECKPEQAWYTINRDDFCHFLPGHEIPVDKACLLEELQNLMKPSIGDWSADSPLRQFVPTLRDWR